MDGAAPRGATTRVRFLLSPPPASPRPGPRHRPESPRAAQADRAQGSQADSAGWALSRARRGGEPDTSGLIAGRDARPWWHPTGGPSAVGWEGLGPPRAGGQAVCCRPGGQPVATSREVPDQQQTTHSRLGEASVLLGPRGAPACGHTGQFPGPWSCTRACRPRSAALHHQLYRPTRWWPTSSAVGGATNVTQIHERQCQQSVG